ncbi:MAG: hypothetical protein K2O12_04475, partial [Muribaculaceae bacterium]|nr:hypothetical protein [Muribaculaceae bacterium]
YIYMDNEYYDNIREMGVKMQLNVLSLTGFYGKSAKTKAEHLAKSGMYALFGSDLHRISQCEHLRKSAQMLHGKYCRSLIEPNCINY